MAEFAKFHVKRDIPELDMDEGDTTSINLEVLSDYARWIESGALERVTFLVAVTTMYESIGNIDFDIYDLEKLPDNHPFAVGLRKGLPDSYLRVSQEDSEAMFSGEAFQQLRNARVKLPGYVQGHVEVFHEG